MVILQKLQGMPAQIIVIDKKFTTEIEWTALIRKKSARSMSCIYK